MRARMVLSAGPLPILLVSVAGLLAGCGGGGGSPSGPADEEKVKIVSVEPADGSYGLGDSTVVRIEFDKPVLEVGAILVPGLRGLGGGGGLLQWLVLSDDKLSFSRTVTLDPNTAYQLVIVSALSADSAGLDEGRIVSFSTTAEPPSGTIEGHITTPGSYDPVGSVLILVDAYHWIGWRDQAFEDYVMALGWVGESGGDFRIEHLTGGKYYLFAFRNVNEDGSYSEEESLFGFYREWIDGFPGGLKAIDVRNNTVTPDVDFTMSPGQDFFEED